MGLSGWKGGVASDTVGTAEGGGGGGEQVSGNRQGLSFKQAPFEVSIGHPRGDVEEVLGNVIPDFTAKWPKWDGPLKRLMGHLPERALLLTFPPRPAITPPCQGSPSVPKQS